MSEKNISSKQREKIEQIKKEWLEEAKPYLNKGNSDKTLDGGNTPLAEIQKKHTKRIQEVIAKHPE